MASHLRDGGMERATRVTESGDGAAAKSTALLAVRDSVHATLTCLQRGMGVSPGFAALCHAIVCLQVWLLCCWCLLSVLSVLYAGPPSVGCCDWTTRGHAAACRRYCPSTRSRCCARE
jgi:hypothetical protein